MPSTATLADGRTVPSDSPEWRDECLARHVLAKPLEQRREWLADHEKRHGPDATAALKATLTALHAAKVMP